MGGHLACLQVSDGKVVWEKDLTKDFGGKIPNWSYRESPLVDGDKLICTPGGPEAILVALDKKTGETIWKSKLPAAENPSPAASSDPPKKPGGRGRGGRGGSGAEPMLRPSRSTSGASANTCSSPPRPSSGLRLPTANFSGDMTVRPIPTGSTARRRSTTMDSYLPRLPMAPAEAW